MTEKQIKRQINSLVQKIRQIYRFTTPFQCGHHILVIFTKYCISQFKIFILVFSVNIPNWPLHEKNQNGSICTRHVVKKY